MTSRGLELFFEVFESLPRQGPGSLTCTQQALSLCRELSKNPRVIDLGCGAGAQTLHLASLLTEASILAVDSHTPLLNQLHTKLHEQQLLDRVETLAADMAALELPAESFDLVWSEGALYNLGIEQALQICTSLLRRGGYLAFTDAVWRSEAPPQAALDLFEEYPTMGRVDDILTLINNHDDFDLVEHFELPQDAWWTEFYAPMEQKLEVLRAYYTNDNEALEALSELAKEPMTYRNHGRHYGYEFFVLRKIRGDS